MDTINEAKLTRGQAAIIGVYTGIVCGPFEDIHELLEKLAGRPIFTHEMGLNDLLMDELKEKAKPLFLELAATK